MTSGAGGGTAMSGRTIAALAVGVGIVVIGAAVLFRPGDPGPGDAGPPQDIAAESGATMAEPGAAAPETDAAPDPQPDPTPQPDAETAAPRFDQIRVAPDGATVIAGQAPAGSDVVLLLDGEEVARTRSGAAGAFASILTLPPSESPRIMSLTAVAPDGTEMAGDETVLIAPFGIVEEAAPELADAEPQDGPEGGAGDGSADATIDIAALETAEAEPPAPADASGGVEAGAPGAGGDAGSVAAPDTGAGTGAEAESGAASETGTTDEPQDDTAGDPATLPAAEDAAADIASDGVTDGATDGAGGASPDTVDMEAAASAPEDSAPDTGSDTGPDTGSDAGQETAPDTRSDTGPEPADASGGDAAPEDGGAPAVVVAGSDGVRVLQGGAPIVQTEVQIDAISYTVEGEVAVSGRGPADQQVQILLNNRPIQLGEIGPGGEWSLELPDVDPGTYTLTVAQLSADGEIESRVDTPFLREDPARIAASPMRVEDGVSVITVQPGFTLWGIAEANFGDGIAYVQIFRENRENIRDPDLIFPGQIFRLPDLPRTGSEP
jgi:nucleoid-associated protein YgaU